MRYEGPQQGHTVLVMSGLATEVQSVQQFHAQTGESLTGVLEEAVVLHSLQDEQPWGFCSSNAAGASYQNQSGSQTAQTSFSAFV